MVIIKCLLLVYTLWGISELLGFKHYAVRLFDYLRIQTTIVVSCLVVVFIVLDGGRSIEGLILILLCGSLLVHSIYLIIPYTIFWPKAQSIIDSVKDFSLMVANLQLDNKDKQSGVSLFQDQNPDILVLLELTSEWYSLMSQELKYEDHKAIVREDPWGMAVYSRFPILEAHDLYVYNGTPTLRLTLDLEGREVDLWILHPKPPSPLAATTSKPKDVEFEVVGNLISRKRPTIVAGDLNDVVWSRATQKLVKTADLVDPRKGRGLMCSFPVYARWMRFPLDQVLVSRDIDVESFALGPDFGSDHFPVIFKGSLGSS